MATYKKRAARKAASGGKRISNKPAKKVKPQKKRASWARTELRNVDRSWFEMRFFEMGIGSKAELARQLDRDPAAVSSLLKGARGVGEDELPVLAEFFKVPQTEIQRRLGVVPALALEGKKTITISGWIDADLNVHYEPPPGPRLAPCPLPAAKDLAALRMQTGNSAGGFPHNSIVYYVEKPDVSPEAVDNFAIIKTVRHGPARFRFLRRGYTEGTFNLFNPQGALTEQNVLLKSAAPVVWIRF